MAITQEHDDEEEGEFDDSAEQSETLNDLAVHSSSSIADLQKLARTHAIYKETESGIYALKKRRRRPRPRHSQGSQHDSSDAGGSARSHGVFILRGNAYVSGGASDSDDGLSRSIKAQALRIYGDNLKTAMDDAMISAKESETALGPPLVAVDVDPAADQSNPEHVGRMVLGISANDRPGLLHDISQALNRLRVQLLHCEASAVGSRSVSIWRLQVLQNTTTKEEITTVIKTLLEPVTGIEAVKKRGQSVVRCDIKAGSSLVGKTPAEADLRGAYGGAIIAVQKEGARLWAN